MKPDIKSIFYHNISKKRCNVIHRDSNFYIDSTPIPTVIFTMDITPSQVRIFTLERFDKEFSPEFTQSK